MNLPSIRNLFLAVICLLLTSLQSRAQLWNSEAGIGLGASIYQGDLSPYWYGAYNHPGPSFQLTGQVPIHPGFAIRAYYAYSSISDNEENYTSGVHRVRNFNFEATINELSAQLVINPFFNTGEEEKGNFHPYFFGGAGVAFLSIKRDWSKFNYSFPYWQSWVLPGLQKDSLTRLPSYAFVFPVGVGLRYQIGDNLALIGEVNKRIVRTEYLDGFSKSANPKEYDGFASFLVGIAFRISGDSGGGGGYNGGGGRGRRNWGSTACPRNVY